METVESLAKTLKLLGDKTRLTIIALLKDGELCVCDIVDSLQMTQPNISQHMRKLKLGGLVKERKKGQWVYYSLDLQDKPYVTGVLQHLPSQKDRSNRGFCKDNECCK